MPPITAKSTRSNLFVLEGNDQKLLSFTPEQWQRFGTALLVLSARHEPEVVTGAIGEYVETRALEDPAPARGANG